MNWSLTTEREQVASGTPSTDRTAGVTVGMRIAQSGYAGVFAAAFLGTTPVGRSGVMAAGLAAALLMTIVCWLVPWQQVTGWLTWAPFAADLALVGLTARAPDGALIALAAVPTIGLGLRAGRHAPVVVVGVLLASVSLPTLLAHDGRHGLAEAVFVPLVAGIAAVLVADLHDSLSARHRSLAQRQREIDATFNSAGVGLVMLDHLGRVTLANDRGWAFIRLAFPPDTPRIRPGDIGQTFRQDGVTPIASEQMPSARAMRGEEFDEYVVWFGRDPQNRRAVSLSSRSIKDSQGRLTGVVFSIDDVTDLTNALRVKDQFVAEVSHELRTPLTSIAGYAEMLREELVESDSHLVRQLDVILRNTDRLHHLVSNLLEVAHPQRADRDEPDGAANVGWIARQAVDSARPAAVEAEVEVRLDLPDKLLVHVRGAAALGQVLDNLLSNAIKYTEPTGTVTVRLARHPAGAVIDVEDTGIGIAPEDVGRVYERFFRCQPARESVIGGVGLGLAIVKQLVDGAGATIDVSSEPGRGSRFRVVWPRSDVAEVVARIAPAC